MRRRMRRKRMGGWARGCRSLRLGEGSRRGRKDEDGGVCDYYIYMRERGREYN